MVQDDLGYSRYDAMMAAGRAAEAAALMAAVVARRPDDVIANYRLGLHHAAVDGATAQHHFRIAAAGVPSVADEWLCRGLALTQLGRATEAEAALRKALALLPGHPHVTYHLAMLLVRADRLADAAHLARASIAGAGEQVPTCFVLAFAQRLQGTVAEGRAAWQRALALSAGGVDTLIDLARLCEAFGLADWAVEACAAALAVEPRPEIQVFHDLVLPQAPESLDEIEWWRARYAANSATLDQRVARLDDPDRRVGIAPWVWLFFQGRNCREVNAGSARLYHRLSPDLSWTAPHCRHARDSGAASRVRVGCFSPTINPFLLGLLRELDRSRFTITHMKPSPQPHPGGPEAVEVDRVVAIPDATLGAAHAAIAAEEFDVLISQPWWALGHFTAYARLAPVQCTLTDPSWNDGVPAFDYYVSWRQAEPAEWAAHYNSPLALLERPPFWFPRDLCRPAALSRSDFDLPQDRRWYVCPHTMPKMHPGYDRMLGDVLRGDPGGCVIVLRADAPVSPLIRSRMRRALADVADRPIFLPTLPADICHGLLRIADAVLDSWPIQGATSSIAALQLGAPLVTLASDLPFGRWTAAMYEAIGISDLIARNEQDFARLARRVACDPGWRAALSPRIAAGAATLLEDRRAVRELEGFLLAAVTRARRGEAPRTFHSGRFAA